jgi:predicted nucleic acid-binding protein
MMNRVMDIETYVPQDGDKYFFDANIWLYFYCPIGDYNKNTISKYAGFLKKSINSKTVIYISSLVISEIVNRWLRLDFGRVKRKDSNIKDFKQHYRGSKYYHSTIKDIKVVFNNQLLKISSPLDDRAAEISLPEVLSGLDKTDFNDSYYYYSAILAQEYSSMWPITSYKQGVYKELWHGC